MDDVFEVPAHHHVRTGTVATAMWAASLLDAGPRPPPPGTPSEPIDSGDVLTISTCPGGKPASTPRTGSEPVPIVECDIGHYNDELSLANLVKEPNALGLNSSSKHPRTLTYPHRLAGASSQLSLWLVLVWRSSWPQFTCNLNRFRARSAPSTACQVQRLLDRLQVQRDFLLRTPARTASERPLEFR